MKKLFVLLTIFGVSTFSFGQRGTIKGKVVSEDSKSIADVTVKLLNTSFGTMTNRRGVYELHGVPAGSYTIEVSSLGYANNVTAITVLANKTTTVATLILEDKQEELQEVVVNGHQNKYSVKTPSTSLRLKTELVKLPQNIQIISSDLLKDQQVTNMMDGVIRNVSGVTMLEHWGNFARVNMRGFRLPAYRNGVNVQATWGPPLSGSNL